MTRISYKLYLQPTPVHMDIQSGKPVKCSIIKLQYGERIFLGRTFNDNLNVHIWGTAEKLSFESRGDTELINFILKCIFKA